MEFRGREPEEGSLHHFIAATSAAAESPSAKGLPKLPTGNLVAGLPAALMSRCQASCQAVLALLMQEMGVQLWAFYARQKA